MSDVPDLVRVAAATPIGNTDHSFLTAVISMSQAISNLPDNSKVILQHQVH